MDVIIKRGLPRLCDLTRCGNGVVSGLHNDTGDHRTTIDNEQPAVLGTFATDDSQAPRWIDEWSDMLHDFPRRAPSDVEDHHNEMGQGTD